MASDLVEACPVASRVVILAEAGIPVGRPVACPVGRLAAVAVAGIRPGALVADRAQGLAAGALVDLREVVRRLVR